MAFSIVCLLGLLAVCGLAALELWRSARLIRALENSLRLLASQRAEQRHAGERRAQLSQTQILAEGTVHGTTAAVRTLHKTIADIPFGIFESIPVTRSTARIVRNIHDRTADGVYGTISTVNRLVGSAARAGLAAGKVRPMQIPVPTPALVGKSLPKISTAVEGPAKSLEDRRNA